jgi:beta-lactamase superfamily II metal-dependent hydrolase
VGYEVDFLSVGDGERSGDAIALRFGDLMSNDRNKQRVVVIDGGFQGSGKDLVNHIKKYYGTERVDLVILTHPDEDHVSGLTIVVNELDVQCLWMHQPWNHAGEMAKAFSDGRFTGEGIRKELRKSLETARDLENLAKRKGIPILEPFAGQKDETGHVVVLGPTRQYYESLLPDFLERAQEMGPSAIYRALAGAGGVLAGVLTKVLERWDVETLTDEGETTPQNNSSAVILVEDGDRWLLFTADAAREGC